MKKAKKALKKLLERAKKAFAKAKKTKVNKTNVALGVLIGLVAIGVHHVVFPPCKPATQSDYQNTFMQCIGELNSEEAYAKACKEIRNEGPSCQFEEKDSAALDKFGRKFFQACAEKSLAEQNICTDKVKETYRL